MVTPKDNAMSCEAKPIGFYRYGRREVIAAFDAEMTSSDGGLLVLREVDQQLGLMARLAGCFMDHRDPDKIEHSLQSLVVQRVFGIACGYEDLNDHDTLRRDPLLAMAAGKKDISGQDRVLAGDRGCPLAGKSTLNRLELTECDATAESRYCKIVYSAEAMDALMVDIFLSSYSTEPKQLVLDIDATNDPLHGQQEGRYFHGYYRQYCYLPLYVFCEGHLLLARVRGADVQPSTGSTQELEAIVRRIRERWPHVQIVVRGDSGFARDELMCWCEDNGVDFVLGLQKNSVLESQIEPLLVKAEHEHKRTGESVRFYDDFRYKTQSSWRQERRVIGKAEYIPGKANPRFVVTSLSPEAHRASALYEGVYCARGDMDSRIKEQQLGLFADRTSTRTMRANQLRLYFSSFAYILMHQLRIRVLAGTELEKAQVWTIRVRLLKVAAVVRQTVRRIVVSLSNTFPLQDIFLRASRIEVHAA